MVGYLKWTPEALAELTEVWMTGVSIEDIAHRFRLSPQGFKYIRRTYPHAFPERPRRHLKRKDLWSQEDMDKAIEMWKAGASQGVIAGALKVTRNMVAGMISRNRDVFSRRAGDSEVKIVRVKREPMAKKAVEVIPFASPAFKPPSPTEYDLSRMAVARPLWEMAGNECKWPLNEGRPFLFCCAQSGAGGIYCQHHAERAVVEVEPGYLKMKNLRPTVRD